MQDSAQAHVQRTAFISNSDCGRHDTGWGHPEHVGRLRAVTRALRDDIELYERVEHVEGRHATPGELELVHDPAYVSLIQRTAMMGGARLDNDTVTSEGSWDAGAAGAGSALDAVEMSLDGRATRAFVAVRPPGHHAVRDRAMGFCLFGNVALAAMHARRTLGAERVLVADWDVHHGNGTQALVEHDRGVHFVSMHQWPFYPGTGAARDRGPYDTVWNVPLPPGLPRERYVMEFEQTFDKALDEFAPDVIILSAGFDSLAEDPIGGFTLELDDVDRLTRFVTARANALCGGRVVSVLEGGYNPARLAAAVVTHVRALADLPAVTPRG
jgi:acetoin utilization deacetylase AcuC-like enzyme